MATLDELFTPLTQADVMAAMLDIATDVGLPVTAWESGGVAREILEIAAQKIADLSAVTTLMAAGGLLDFAVNLPDPKWLRLTAASMYGVEWIPATFGTTNVLMTNASGVTYTPAAGDLHFLNTVTGQTYTNTTGGTLAASGGTLTVTVQADVSGTIANANPGDISALVTPLLGVTMTNANALVGVDDETSEHLAQRCREKLAAASPNGPSAAYDYFASTATRISDGSNVGVTRTFIVEANGSLTLYCASASGGITGTAGDPTTDLGAVNTAIQTNCVPTGITCTVATAVEHDIDIQATVYLKAGSTVSSAQARTTILDALTTYFSTIPIGGFNTGSGGFVFLDAVIGQIYQAVPDAIEVVITSPGANVSMADSDVAVLTSILTDFTIVHT